MTDWPPQYDVMSVCGIPLLISQSSIDSWYIHLLNSRCRTITLWKGGVSTFRDERGLYFTELKPEINTLTSLEETLSATLLFAAKRNFNKFVEFGDFSQIEQWERQGNISYQNDVCINHLTTSWVVVCTLKFEFSRLIPPDHAARVYTACGSGQAPLGSIHLPLPHIDRVMS